MQPDCKSGRYGKKLGTSATIAPSYIWVRAVVWAHGCEQMHMTNTHVTSSTTHAKCNKSSAVANMGDRGHDRHGLKRGGGLLCPFWTEMGPRLIQCGLGRGLLPYKVVSSLSSYLAIIDMNRKLGGCATFREELQPHTTQRRLGRGLPPYQVAS